LALYNIVLVYAVPSLISNRAHIPYHVGSALLVLGISASRWRAQRVLCRQRRELGMKVEAQTNELRKANEELRAEIAERKQAESALKDANEQLHILSQRIFQVQEDEKRHLARELHDQVGQTLTAAKLSLKIVTPDAPPAVAGRLTESTQILDCLLQQVRQISLDLRPPLLDELGLVPALRWLADQQAQRAALRITFAANLEFPEIDPAIQTACFRIAQEAITNSIRHANAETIGVQVYDEAGRLWLSVRDNGTGFDPDAAGKRALRGASLGLPGMKERVLLTGGLLEVNSTPGDGTEIRAWFPLSMPEYRSAKEAQ
jgi:signal transduction histidine kinase